MSIGFGIIGCGMISTFHARAIAELHGAKLVACYSQSKEKAVRLAGLFGGHAHETQEQLLTDPAVDVVIVCTPSGAHMEPAIAAARAGKHVVVEKPLEVTLKRCDAIIQECKKHKVLLATIFPSRFNAASAHMKEAVEQGRFGRLTLAEAYVKWYRTQAYYDSGAWRGTRKFDGGGALMNQAIHSVDLLCWLMGPVQEVSAYTATLAHDRIEVEDVAVATLRFANGALGVIEATTAAWPGYLKRIEIHGSEGAAALQEEDLVTWDFMHKLRGDAVILRRMGQRSAGSDFGGGGGGSGVGGGAKGGGAAVPSAIDFQPHARQLRDFILAVREGRPPSVDGREGRRAVEIILAIYKSAQTGRPVALPLDRDPVLAPMTKSKAK